MWRKTLRVIGIIGYVVAADGTYRISLLERMFGGGGQIFFLALLLLAVVSAGVVLVSFFTPISFFLKVPLIGLSVISIIFFSSGPSVGAVSQAIAGFVLGIAGALAMDHSKAAGPKHVVLKRGEAGNGKHGKSQNENEAFDKEFGKRTETQEELFARWDAEDAAKK